jgi:hypothetical protein
MRFFLLSLKHKTQMQQIKKKKHLRFHDAEKKLCNIILGAWRFHIVHPKKSYKNISFTSLLFSFSLYFGLNSGTFQKTIY